MKPNINNHQHALLFYRKKGRQEMILLPRSMQFPAEAWLRFSLYHASITWLQIYPNGRVTLRIYGDVGHMSPDKMTST